MTATTDRKILGRRNAIYDWILKGAAGPLAAYCYPFDNLKDSFNSPRTVVDPEVAVAKDSAYFLGLVPTVLTYIATVWFYPYSQVFCSAYF